MVPLNPEEGGVVVAMVKAGTRVQDDENLLIYQSTKQIRIAGSGFDNDMKASLLLLLLSYEARAM